ncbi:MAG: glycosyltransferase family 2 protein [Thermodesulfobacteriota bacterium]|nr:glycosyltransferase family 2 protein [Thermodesulfobacteriota bacterium]
MFRLTKKLKKDISVIIPMCNEEENLKDTVNEVKEVLNSLSLNWEIILVDDGSVDNTPSIAREISNGEKSVKLRTHSRNYGRGRAIRTGFNACQGNIIVTIDADLSYDPLYILDVYNCFQSEPDIHVVLPSPYMPGGSTQKIPFFRLLVSRIGNKILSFSMSKKIYTITSIFRGYRKEVIDCLELESDDKEIHLEILTKVLAMGYQTKEIPSVLRNRRKGKSKFKFRTTAYSHLIFTAFERPMILFGLLGIVIIFTGVGLGIHLTMLWLEGTLSGGRPLISFMILIILIGMQILSFGFIGTQIVNLRKELYKIQKNNRLLQKKLEEKF